MQATAHQHRTEPPAQFDVARHYDVMEQLDRDVHDNSALAWAEVGTAIRLIGHVPRSVFLPCFGTGRHINALLWSGVQRIVGVDLSPKCVAKALKSHGQDPRVQLHIGDLTTWRTNERFDASILLGNSFGDVVDPDLLLRITRGMIDPLAKDGAFLMDFIGQGYLDRCRVGKTVVWQAELDGTPVNDARTPRFDPTTGIMTINVKVTDRATDRKVWRGAYQKLILGDDQVVDHFARVGMPVHSCGKATDLNPYYKLDTGELGMIARSTWWLGNSTTT